jgi:hypothetical protein
MIIHWNQYLTKKIQERKKESKQWIKGI